MKPEDEEPARRRIEERPFACLWCGTAFATQADLAQHWLDSAVCGASRKTESERTSE